MSSLPIIIPIAASVLGVVSILFPQMLPAMVSQGKFTLTARALNVSGGILFLSASIHFYIKYRKFGNLGDLIFTNHCLLFGMAGLLFELSVLWGAGWWWWHFLRLAAYLLALCYLLVIYRRLEETVRIANEQLNNEVIERRHREGDLEKYGLLFDNISDLAYICDTEGNILFLNRVFEELSGHKPEQFIGKSFAPLFDEENLKKAMDLYTRTLKGEILKREVCFKDTGVLCEYKNKPLRDKKGNIVGVLGTARDITERKHLENERKNINKSLEQRVARRTKEWAKANEALQIKIVQHTRAEKLLQKSKEQLQSILDNSPAVIYLKDKNGKYILINCQFETLFHVNRIEIMGKTDLDIFPGEMAGVLQANDRKVLKAGVPLELEEIVLHDDGPHIYISLKFPLFDSSGVPDRVCGISTNITKRKRAEEVLRKSEAKYSRLIENLQENYFFYAHNAEGVFTYLSPAITNILGYTTEEFLTHYSEYMTNNPINEKVIRHTDLSIKGIKQPSYALEIYHKDGSRRTLKVQEVPVFDKSHKVIAVEGIAEDITESKLAEEKLVTYQTQLKRLSSALSLTEERERRHISEDLHDRIGQALTVIRY
jgi:PAS domain S-box-containing protein